MLMVTAAMPFSVREGPAEATPSTSAAYNYPNVPPSHRHLRLLLDNAFQYLDPAHDLIDAASGYPVEGWNHEPQQGLFLRSFTQLTAIGAWIELLANVAAGYADTPHLSRDSALSGLELAVGSLLTDQHNPALGAKGLLVNFLGLEGGGRTGPLLESIERQRFIDAFGDHDGTRIWLALVEKGWLQEEDNGQKGRIRRGEGFGALHFDGVLAPFSEGPLRSRILDLLDQRVVTIIFGDNANLTAALAKAVGALLGPDIRDNPRAAGLREQMERFIEGQRAGYAHLYDAASGTFYFGWDATTDRFVGWEDGRGNWLTGQMNYYINEFRGPWTFVVLRYDLPIAAIRNAGFKVKPYTRGDGSHTYALAAWDGSAFQLLGLSLFMQEARNPGWRASLEALVDIALDFSNRNGLPGLLSESYSGNGTEYTGLIGIPDIAVTDKPLNTRSPSLYALGVAYAIAPEKIETFLGRHWPLISGLFTPHGPWEGWNLTTRSVIPYQTTVHTLSLILGAINSAHENMARYLDVSGLDEALESLYAPGDRVNLLDEGTQIIPWSSDESPIAFSRGPGSARFATPLGAVGGLAFVVPGEDGINLSNGRLILRFRSQTRLGDASISFKRVKSDPLPPPTIPVELLVRFKQTNEDEIQIVLPPTPALKGLKEVNLTLRSDGKTAPVDLSILSFDFIPFDQALAAPR